MSKGDNIFAIRGIMDEISLDKFTSESPERVGNELKMKLPLNLVVQVPTSIIMKICTIVIVRFPG